MQAYYICSKMVAMNMSIDIDRPPSDVWPWLTEFGKKQQWCKGLLSEEWYEGDRSTAGSRFKVKIKGYELGESVKNIIEPEIVIPIAPSAVPRTAPNTKPPTVRTNIEGSKSSERNVMIPTNTAGARAPNPRK